MSIYIDTPIQYIKGVGPKLSEVFRKRGILTAGDLLHWYPRAYQDQRAANNISSLQVGQTVSVKGRVLRVSSVPMGKSTRRIHEVLIGDSSGRIPCKFFRTPYRGYFERFKVEQEVRVTGKLIEYRGIKQFQHPTIEMISGEEPEEDALIPLYTETDGLSPAKLKKIINTVIDQLIDHPEVENKERIVGVPDELPKWIKSTYDLLDRDKALKYIHQPLVDQAASYFNFEADSQKRLIFDEFFWLELHLAMKKAGYEKARTQPIVNDKKMLISQLLKKLPFTLTGAQERSLQEIYEDMKNPHPMHRLVQGDVGSGKTLVALLSALYVIEMGYQATIMAPTEILAEQHYQNAKKLLEPLGVQVALLTSQVKGKKREQICKYIQMGEFQLVVGTHALIQEDVIFNKLSLAIIDEQHRFGVEQRSLLKHKGDEPHFLVMTATPIPRTLAMTVYGDLDVSVIDELPQGRQPIVTRSVFENKRSKVFEFLGEQVAKGRQAYIVYPLVEESESMDLKNATAEYENIQKMYPNYKVGLLHGKLKSEEKDQIMRSFKRNEIQILVSTTVIEVGVDVPNANIMVIEHSERFGLSQLHQLRGRVGRGTHKSYCVLMLSYQSSQEARDRAQTMVQYLDGFKIAEADLEQRGPGEFLGRRQSGLAGFKLANLVRDMKILMQARKAAFELVSKDPFLQQNQHQSLKQQLELKYHHYVG
ncbi:MAG: ATP-dependent DNA helicase RecG [Bdellovibrionales bacterium]|nr:ATP-dependent DNA helicase RecG [Bdellovibrionales bacterium]